MENQIRIRCFASFTNSQNLHDSYERYIIPPKIIEHYGKDKQYFFTTGDDYTHVFIINTAMPNISHIPKQNVIGFAHEPIAFLQLTDEFVHYAKKNISKYFLGDKMDLPDPFIEGHSFLCCHEIPLFPTYYKLKFMSIMISQKTSAPGHQYRHKLVQAILKTRLPIDIHGRGCVYYKNINDSRIKGNFKNYELYDGYQFNICIENFQTNHYFSEKIINPLLMNITPIYSGCKNIASYFPNMYLTLSGDINKDIQLLHEIFKHPEKYILNIDVEKVNEKVDLILNLPNLFPLTNTNTSV
jgi:hypothetical protein